MKSQSPFLDAFRQAVHPDFVPSALTPCELVEDRMTDRPRTTEEWAAHYRCSVRTIAAFKAEGVSLADPTAVAIRLVNSHSPATPMLERVGQLLDELTTTTEP